MLGERAGELREDGRQVREEEGAGAEWLEDASCEFFGGFSVVCFVGRKVTIANNWQDLYDCGMRDCRSLRVIPIYQR